MSKMDEAIALGTGIEVWVSHPELEDYEVIINSKNNVKVKKAYYDSAYDDNMRLKHNTDIAIEKIHLD